MRSVLAPLSIIAAALLGACAEQTPSERPAAAQESAEATVLHVADPYIRATLPGQRNAAMFFELMAEERDALISAASDIAETVEIHETISENDVMRMRRLEAIEIAPGRAVSFAPGGLHLMLIGLRAPLADGDSARVELIFRSGRRLAIEAPVRAVIE